MQYFRKVLIVILGLLILLLVLPYFIPLSKPKCVNQLKPYNNSHFCEIEGVMIHYRIWQESIETESKPWIFLVHGFSATTYSWEKSIEPLTESGFNVIAVDVPPFGYSDKNPRLNHSPDNRAVLLWHFLDSVQPNSSWNFVGHSMGGGIVTAMAILQPQRVEKVVLVDPSLFRKLKPERSLGQILVSLHPVERLFSVLGEIFFIKTEPVKKLLYTAYQKQPTAEQTEAYLRGLQVPGTARGIVAAFSKAKPSHKLSIEDFKSTAIAIWGDNDTWIPFERMKSITDSLDNVSVHIIENSGHVPQETDPEIFNSILLSFLLQ